MAKIKIYTNEGKTVDRYTVAIDDALYTMSENPTSPQGVNQYLGRVEDYELSNFGRVLSIYDVSSDVMEAIQDRVYMSL